MGSYRALHDGWTLTGAAHEIEAAVPGCVHTDLLAAGVIDDPFLDDNEVRQEWIGRTDWVYETTFDWQPDELSPRTDLVCDGLDTIAALTLNGTEIGRTANMHRSYRFDVASTLTEGSNTLRVAFTSAKNHAEAERERLGDRPNAYPEPFHFIRKMACSFGWDWGPTLITAGIWRPIGLHTWAGGRIARVRPLVTVTEDGDGRIELHVDVERAGADPLVLAASVAGVRVEQTLQPDEDTAVLVLDVPQPARWWPHSLGEQPLHPVDVALTTTGGTSLDEWHRRVGFRTVALDTADGAFTLAVNDVPLFARGVNWIPDDALVTRITRGRLRERLGQAVEANIDTIRVWGGGLYESDDFYEICDELGLLVLQDFPFACAAYPEEEPLASEIAAEARENVVRLASHPSLVAWTGNNENIWGWHDWDWQPALGDRTWGAGYYFDLLPEIVGTLDPTRPYWPGSPWSGDHDTHPNEPSRGTTHIWDVWNQVDYAHYRDYRPRFVAEFGFQAPPAFATLRRAISDEPLTPSSPGLAHHQKAIDGNLKLERGLTAHLPAPRDFDDWHFLTQVNQARAITLGVEHFRSLRPYCMGSVVWQLNDCWPVTSWSAIDGDGRRKPLWYALRRSYADRLLTVQPRPHGPAVIAVNDGRSPWTSEIEVTRRALDGTVLAKAVFPLSLGPRESVTTPLPPEIVTPADPAAEVCVVTAGADRALWFFAEDKEINFPAPGYETEVAAVEGGYHVTVTAGTVLRDLTLQADRLDPGAVVDTALVTLLPGETTTFRVRTDATLDAAGLTARPVLRCVNDVRP
ncbi:glycoside hydrolase family 2 protein [Catenuloplanes indicus]|uniref:beta-mannosidase n=1 Tax=Catenuloplanes indicus TaxID=137267 RepID=A0AAE4B2F7_9ACTN|nr:glycoside hydrolase family 2 protein [Catenuloplanes indicus]MDQ0368943.1 beta-mannosidase [Catenuloplanes indicus]